MHDKFKVTMIGTGDPSKPPLLISCVKTYLESRDSLKNKIKITQVYPGEKGVFDGVKEEVLKKNPTW